MHRSRKAGLAVVASLVLGALPAAAATPFKCPHRGGHFVFGQEANINSLDQMTSGTISTRNVAMNIFETLLTRDEHNNPILGLADSYTESPDHLTYTFKLRPGVTFQNGKKLTAADVVASFNRYERVGLLRSMLDNVAGWEAPDAATFVIHMKRPQPTFILQLSSFDVPIVIVPAAEEHDPPQQLKPVGTGPWQLVQFTPGSSVELKRNPHYTPNPHFTERTGFGGYKQACFDTVTFRIVTEPGARVAGMETGELQGVEDVPAKSIPDLKKDKNITLLPLPNWWIQIAIPNTSVPPTDNLDFRRAVQAVLNMNDIMDAASDGNYRLNVGFQYPTQSDYTDAGKDTYNMHDPKLAKQYLAKSGYKGEPVVLLTDKDYPQMYNSALVMQQQLQSIGINAKLRVTDWPTSVLMSHRADTGWNFFFTGWGTPTSLGALDTMQNLIEPNATYMPKGGKDDPELLADWKLMNQAPTAAARQAAFAAMQKRVLDQVYEVPFGSYTKMQAVRADVKGFVPFRIPRMSNVWFAK